MTNDQKTTVKAYVTTLNSNVSPGALLDLVIDTTVDRVLLYLNETALDPKLNRVIAQVVVSAYKQATADGTSLGVEQGISSASDNGQTVHFSATKQYLTSTNDQELFSGFTGLLNSYRRPHVITSRI